MLACSCALRILSMLLWFASYVSLCLPNFFFNTLVPSETDRCPARSAPAVSGARAAPAVLYILQNVASFTSGVLRWPGRWRAIVLSCCRVCCVPCITLSNEWHASALSSSYLPAYFVFFPIRLMFGCLCFCSAGSMILILWLLISVATRWCLCAPC